MKNYRHGILMALGTALAWGGTGPIAKMITVSGLSQITVVCYRAVFVALVVGCWLWLRQGLKVFRVPVDLLAVYVLIGIFVLVFNAAGYMMSCVYLSVPQVLMLNYTFPIVTMAGSIFLTGERPTAVQVVSAFMVLFGLYIGFVMGKASGGPISLFGVAWAGLSVIGLAGQALLSRKVSMAGRSDPLLQLFFSHLFGGIILIIAKTVLVGWSDMAALSPRVFALIQYPAVISALIGYGLLFSALKYIPASLASLICTMEIVFALMLSPLLLHQIPPVNEIAGCTIILAAVACSIGKQKSEGAVLWSRIKGLRSKQCGHS